MKIADIGEEIIRDARKEAESIVEGARKEARERISRERSTLREEKKRILSEFEDELRKRYEEQIAAERLESKKRVMMAKEEVVNEILGLVRDSLSSYVKTKAYANHLKAMVKKVKEELGKDVIVHCSPRDAKILRGMKVKVKTDKDIEAGILATNPKGTVRVDLRFNTLLRDRRGRIKMMIYKELFE